MVHASQQRLDFQVESLATMLNEQSSDGSPDLAIVLAAREIYRVYRETFPTRTQKPLGVAINQYTLRGKLILNRKPILLPQERFIPLSQLESEAS